MMKNLWMILVIFVAASSGAFKAFAEAPVGDPVAEAKRLVEQSRQRIAPVVVKPSEGVKPTNSKKITPEEQIQELQKQVKKLNDDMAVYIKTTDDWITELNESLALVNRKLRRVPNATSAKCTYQIVYYYDPNIPIDERPPTETRREYGKTIDEASDRANASCVEIRKTFKDLRDQCFITECKPEY